MTKGILKRIFRVSTQWIRRKFHFNKNVIILARFITAHFEIIRGIFCFVLCFLVVILAKKTYSWLLGSSSLFVLAV